MGNKKEAPKMDKATIKIFEGIIKDVNELIDDEYEELFKEAGCRKIVEKKMAEDGVSKKDIKEIELRGMSSKDLINDAKIDFRLIPDILDGATKRPVKGKACLLVVKNVVSFDFMDKVSRAQLDALRVAHKQNPKNKHVEKALEMSEKLFKEPAKGG